MTDKTKKPTLKPTIDFASFTLAELIEHKQAIQDAIDVKKEEQREALIARLSAQASESGFDPSDLIRGVKHVSNAVARYRNPKNPIQTWSGAGRRPGWLIKELESGKKMEDFQIQA